MEYVELEISLYAPAEGRLSVDVRLRSPDNAAETMPASGVPLYLDQRRLLALQADAEGYGRALTGQLFAAPEMREAWATAHGYIQGANAPLRLRLRIAPGAEALHALRWELLQNPRTGSFLCQSERLLFSRYLDTEDLGTLKAPSLASMRALAVVANPTDLEEHNLAPIDAAGEVERTCRALGETPTTVLARVEQRPRPTLVQILDELRAGHALLYLVCHGMLVEGEGRSYLWLEREDGGTDRVSGETLVQRIADLPPERRPRLIVLAVCQSAGRDDAGPVLAALGPQLARAGVGAVIGMQGLAPLALIERLMPRMFELLRNDGRIDRALALARADLPPGMSWWMPALYMRVRDGRLWVQERVVGAANDLAPQVAAGLDALLELLHVPDVRTTVAVFRTRFIESRAQVGDLIALKELHDLLHALQFQCYIPLTREARGFPDDDLAIENMRDYGLTLRTHTDEIRAAFARTPEPLGDGGWLDRLDQAYAYLEQAFAEHAEKALKQALWAINSVLAVQPSYINANLITRASTLRLNALVAALGELRTQLSGVTLDQTRLARFETGVAALADLDARLNALIGEHDAWQAIDRELRRIAASLRHDADELAFSWPDLRASLAPLVDADAAWAHTLREQLTQLDEALAGTSAQRPVAVFQRCNRLIGERFFQVDGELKRLCGQLRELRDPLNELERMLA